MTAAPDPAALPPWGIAVTLLTLGLAAFGAVSLRYVRARNAHRRAAYQVEALVAASPLPVVGLLADGTVTSWNGAAERLFGWTAAEVVGGPLPIVPDDRAAEYAGLRARVLRGDAFTGYETTRRRKDGSPLEVSISTAPLRGAGGAVVGLVSVYVDVTERRRAEEERRLLLQREREARAQAEVNERHYRELAEAMPQIVWTARADGWTDYFNRRWYDYTGLQPGEADGWEWGRAVHPEDLPRCTAAWAESLRRAEPYEIEYRFRRRDGAYRWHLGRAVPLKDAARRVVRWVGTCTDVHDQREAEAQLRQAQRMEAVGQLAGGVAHDFNNILTAMESYAAFLQERLPPSTQEYADVEGIRQMTRRAASLTRQLLAFSRRQILQPEILDLNAVVHGTTDMLRRLLGEHVTIEFVPDAALGPVYADPAQLEQVVVNLAVNARDAMPGGGHLTIETRNVELDAEYARHHLGVAPGRYVMLAVSDTGHGMDAETKARIFEPFFTTKERGKGTGLGLATVFGIVRQSGGHVFVYSEPGQGTTFKIYLPRGTEAVAGEPDRPAPVAAVGGEETILLVEDDPTLRELARRALAQHGYTVLVAASPGEAILVSEQHRGPVHLLLTDVMMPRMNGRQLAERLLPTRPEMSVLYMSGYTDNAIVHHGVLDPGTPFLEKPFSPDALVLRVRQVLDAGAASAESA